MSLSRCCLSVSLSLSLLWVFSVERSPALGKLVLFLPAWKYDLEQPAGALQKPEMYKHSDSLILNRRMFLWCGCHCDVSRDWFLLGDKKNLRYSGFWLSKGPLSGYTVCLQYSSFMGVGPWGRGAGVNNEKHCSDCLREVLLCIYNPSSFSPDSRSPGRLGCIHLVRWLWCEGCWPLVVTGWWSQLSRWPIAW